MKMKIKELTGTIKLVTGLHIGAGNTEIHIGGTDSPVVKHPQTLEPYIPGSSLKGKMRALLELYCGVLKDENPVSLSNLNGSNNKDVVNIIKLFGISAGKDTKVKDNKEENTAKTDALPEELKNKPLVARLSFYDCPVSKENDADILIEIKAENSINRKSGTANAPRFIERVPSGIKFDFKLTVKCFTDKNDKDDELKEFTELKDMLEKGLKLLELDGIGGSGSRGYGKIEFEDLKWYDADHKELKNAKGEKFVTDLSQVKL